MSNETVFTLQVVGPAEQALQDTHRWRGHTLGGTCLNCGDEADLDPARLCPGQRPKIALGTAGLDAMLGGGLPASCAKGATESSSICLLRGGPGSGKSVLGAQIAAAAAEQLMVDVAYACIEALPTELAAQRCGLGRPTEELLRPPFQRQVARRERGTRLFAGMLEGEMGSDFGRNRAEFLPSLRAFLDVVMGVGGSPRVLVVDALSDGYGLGASAPWDLAEAVQRCAHGDGLILILAEETVDERPSPWPSFSDVVIELGLVATAEGFERCMTVTKNGTPIVGEAHRFTIETGRGVLLAGRSAEFFAGP